MSKLLSKGQFIDKLLEECEDQIENKDIKGILDWFSKMKESNDTHVVITDASNVFINLFINILSFSELEQNKDIFGPYFYMLLAYHMNLSDIIINFPNSDDKYSSLSNWISEGVYDSRTNFTFNSITFETANLSHYLSCSCLDCYVNITKKSPFPILYLDRIDCKNLDIESFNVGYGDEYNEYIKARSIENIIYEDSCVVQNTVPKIIFTDNVPINLKSIVLPNVDGIQIPRWMCNLDDNLTIYKAKNQKVSIYSSNKEWLKNHVKYI